MTAAHSCAAAEPGADGTARGAPQAGSRHSRLLIYDGGMGTTLEDDFGADISSNLWSSNLLRDEKNGHETLRALHNAFLNAGADLVQSCTYQSYLEGFIKNRYSETQAKQMMRGAVALVSDSVAAASLKKGGKGKGREIASGEPEPGVVLALSCYGATLSPGQEYTGVYPPPFGPPAETSTTVQDASWRVFAIEALAEWHFDRLKVFAEDVETWNKVRVVAFETLPIMYEAIAIRQAMTRLRAFLASSRTANLRETSRAKEDKLHWPNWWISFVFPDGELPTRTSQERGTAPIAPSELARAVFSDLDYQKGQLEIPTGIGINCTKMRYLPAIAQELTLAVRQLEQRDSLERWLVLYPDGGLVYDPFTRTWHQDDAAAIVPVGENGHAGHAGDTIDKSQENSRDSAAAWAAQLVKIADDLLGQTRASDEADAQGQHVWDKIVLGGCCKASPAYIAELSKVAKKPLNN